LIVEDEPAIAENIAFGLQQEGFASEWKMTGFEAVAALRGGGFALVILDVGLPDTTGFEVCKQVRAFSNLPILFLTARSEEIDRILGLEIGGDDYVCKPFSVRELATRVRAILRRAALGGGSAQPAAVEAGTQQHGPFALDEERYQIALEGKALTLTRYEYRLLALLVKRRGKVLTREQLMYQVWEEPEASGERTVDAHVKSLRAKLREVSGDVEYIRTLRGIGYSLEY
jgi:two-component system catabolic regulation response regulator CreB